MILCLIMKRGQVTYSVRIAVSRCPETRESASADQAPELPPKHTEPAPNERGFRSFYPAPGWSGVGENAGASLAGGEGQFLGLAHALQQD